MKDKLINMTWAWDKGMLMNSVKWPCSPWVLVALWIDHPPCVREVMGLIPFGDSDISSSHARAMLINSSFTTIYIVTIFDDWYSAYWVSLAKNLKLRVFGIKFPRDVTLSKANTHINSCDLRNWWMKSVA